MFEVIMQRSQSILNGKKFAVFVHQALRQTVSFESSR